MDNNRVIIAEIYRQASFFLLLTALMLPLIAWVAGDAWLFYAYILAVPFFFMMFVRTMFGSFFIFAALHLLAAASVAIWPVSGGLKLVGAGFLAVSVILSFHAKLSKNSAGLTMGMLILVAGANLAANVISQSAGLSVPTAYFAANTFAVTLCYFLYGHVTDVGQSLEAITLTSSQPVKSIKKFNNAAIAVFILLACVLAYFSGYFQIGTLIRQTGAFLLFALRFLFSLIGDGEAPLEEIVETPVQPPPDQTMNELMMLETKDPFILWVILEKILFFLFYVVIVVGVIAGVAYLFYKLYKKFYAEREFLTDVKEFILPDENVAQRIAARLSDLLPGGGFAPANRIRRQFYKKVKKHIKNGAEVAASDTAKEIAVKLKPREDIDAITAAYERARYL